MAATVYSLAAVGFIFGGVPATGFAEGGAFTIAMKEDFFSSQVGVSGEVVRAASLNELAEVSLMLLQSSPYNDYLSAIHTADKLSSKMGKGGSGVLPFAAVDTNGTTYAQAGQMWITKAPDLKRTNKNSDVEWKFEAAAMKVFIGGMIA